MCVSSLKKQDGLFVYIFQQKILHYYFAEGRNHFTIIPLTATGPPDNKILPVLNKYLLTLQHCLM